MCRGRYGTRSVPTTLMNADELKNLEAILHSPSYLLAEHDTDFLRRPALRPVRLQLDGVDHVR